MNELRKQIPYYQNKYIAEKYLVQKILLSGIKS